MKRVTRCELIAGAFAHLQNEAKEFGQNPNPNIYASEKLARAAERYVAAIENNSRDGGKRK